MHGIVVQYNEAKGYGFIRTKELEDNVFIHVSNIENASKLSEGQKVSFEVEETQKGLSAVNLKAGATQKSPYFIFATVSFVITLVIFSYLYKNELTEPIISYLIAINLTTFLLYGYDKFISSSNRLRVPEWNLHALALLGGSLGGLFAQKSFRHKTIKGSFQLVYWAIVVLQVGLLYWLR